MDINCGGNLEEIYRMANFIDIRIMEWQTEDMRSVGRPKHCWRNNIVGQQGIVWMKTAKDRESWTDGRTEYGMK